MNIKTERAKRGKEHTKGGEMPVLYIVLINTKYNRKHFTMCNTWLGGPEKAHLPRIHRLACVSAE